MSERDQTPSPSGSRSPQDEFGRPADDWREQTTPGIPPVAGSSSYGAQGSVPQGYQPQGNQPQGYPGYQSPGYDPQAGEGSTAPQYSTQPVKIRRADPLAALLLILAGLAAGVSLLLSWLPGDDTRGWDILRLGFDTVRDEGWGELFSTGLWQPVAVMLGGGVLFVLGLLLLIPARAHRLLGLLALLVSIAVAAGVLVPLADGGWQLDDFRLGFLFAIAVAGLGLLGSLKALLTGPKRGTTPPA